MGESEAKLWDLTTENVDLDQHITDILEAAEALVEYGQPRFNLNKYQQHSYREAVVKVRTWIQERSKE